MLFIRAIDPLTLHTCRKNTHAYLMISSAFYSSQRYNMTKMIATWAAEEVIKVQIKMGAQQKEQV